MAKLKHVAITTQDPTKTANFYKEAFELEEVGKIDSDLVEGYFLTDGNVNLAILKFKNEAVAGKEFGTSYTGIHHIGFEVESLEEIAAKMQAANSSTRDDINQALGVGMPGANHANVEVKYGGPDGVIIDVSETGWVGTRGLD